MPTRRLTRFTLVAAIAIYACDFTCAWSQTTAPATTQTAPQVNDLVAHAHTPSVPSSVLTLTAPGKTLTFTPADLKAMPHKTVTVHNEHTQTSETYTGVPLTDLLTLAGVPVGKDLRGKAFLLYILAEGTDHYRVLYSLSEVDPVNHTGDVIVADTLNGSALTTDGALKLVSSEDKRPARWVRNLTAITIKQAE